MSQLATTMMMMLCEFLLQFSSSYFNFTLKNGLNHFGFSIYVAYLFRVKWKSTEEEEETQKGFASGGFSLFIFL